VAFVQVSQTGAASFIYTAPAGAGTLKLQVKQNNTGGTAVIEGAFLASVLNYVVLGS